MTSIIIDAGHGGNDPGATAFNTKEKDWTLKMSLYQYNRLKELGVNVSLTRSKDETLDANTRAKRVKSKYTYCISNHFNAFNGTARGIETIHSIYANGKFAQKIAKALQEATKLPLRRSFSRKNNMGTDWYYMHRLTGSTKTVIVEYGFLDNREDYAFYNQEANFIQAAEAVIKVLCEMVGKSYKEANQKLYRVQVGAFSNKQNAENMMKQLKKSGYDAYIPN